MKKKCHCATTIYVYSQLYRFHATSFIAVNYLDVLSEHNDNAVQISSFFVMNSNQMIQRHMLQPCWTERKRYYFASNLYKRINLFSYFYNIAFDSNTDSKPLFFLLL